MLPLAHNVIVVCAEYKLSLNGFLHEVGTTGKKSLPPPCLKVPNHSAVTAIVQVHSISQYARLIKSCLQSMSGCM